MNNSTRQFSKILSVGPWLNLTSISGAILQCEQFTPFLNIKNIALHLRKYIFFISKISANTNNCKATLDKSGTVKSKTISFSQMCDNRGNWCIKLWWHFFHSCIIFIKLNIYAKKNILLNKERRNKESREQNVKRAFISFNIYLWTHRVLLEYYAEKYK